MEQLGEPQGSPRYVSFGIRGLARCLGIRSGVSMAGLDHVQVAAPAGCEEDAGSFYGGLLGLEEIPKPALLSGGAGAGFGPGAHELHVGVAELPPGDEGPSRYRADVPRRAARAGRTASTPPASRSSGPTRQSSRVANVSMSATRGATGSRCSRRAERSSRGDAR